ncbi:MAG: DUF2970 domain-containing protein [Rubrivivax sp.]
MSPGDVQRPDAGVSDALSRPLSPWETMRAVLWSFFGVRRRDGYERDVQRLNPLYVIVAGVLAAALFVLALVLAVQWVVRSGVAL